MPMMRNSRLPDDWLQRAVAGNPIKPFVDPTTGKPNGLYLTCPVRLAFPNLFKPSAGNADSGQQKVATYNTTLLFPLCATDMVWQTLWAVAHAELCKEFPEYVRPDNTLVDGLHVPFHDQEMKAMKYAGYTPGAIYIAVSSQFQPAIVDDKLNRIVDESQIYAGCWAIVALNCYTYGGPRSKNKLKKGVAFGLQTVMKIADDEKLGGGGADPSKTFAGVQVDATFNAAAAIATTPGAPRTPPRPPGTGIMPPAQPVVAQPPRPAALPPEEDVSEYM